MKTIGRRKWLILPVLFLILPAAVFFGSRAWEQYRSTHYKSVVEILYCYPESNFVLAAGLEDDKVTEGLFTFSWPEKNTDPALKRPGMVVELTGPEWINITYPAQYHHVLAVKKVEERPDFVELHYDRILAEYLAAYVTPDGTTLFDFLQTQEGLNTAERAGLHYRIVCELGVF